MAKDTEKLIRQLSLQSSTGYPGEESGPGDGQRLKIGQVAHSTAGHRRAHCV